MSGIKESKAHAHNLPHLFELCLAPKSIPIYTEDIAKVIGHTSIEVTKILRKAPIVLSELD